MRAIAIVSSVGLHAGLLFAMSMIPDRTSAAATQQLIELTLKPKPPPPPPVPKVEEKKEEIVPPPEVKPQVVKKLTVKKSVADEAQPQPEQKLDKPKIPPQGFSVDMESTVIGGGLAVPAVEGGGNMFADPNQKNLHPGQKTSVRPEEAGGQGRGTAPTGSYQVTSMPEFIGSEAERTPPFPEDAKLRGVQGQVLLKVYVNAQGRVAQVRITRKLDPSCDEIAVKWAKDKFRFKPAMRGEEAIGVWIDVPVTFVIDR